MMRTPSAALTPLSDALDLLRGLIRPVAQQTIALAAADGRIAAATILSPDDCPSAATALRDGFAVEAAAIAGASPYAPVLLPRSPSWIEAGAPLPETADALLPAEGLEGRSAVAEAGAGDGIRGGGEDFSRGDAILEAGERIGPLHLLALAAAGVATTEIRRPRLRLVVTGAPERDALSPMLAALIGEDGAETETVAAPDEPEAIAAAIRAGSADAVLVLGGTGYGRSDRSAEGLARAGRIHAHGLALRPGETAGIGAADGRPVLLLPGRPDAALAVFLALGRPLIAALAGARTPRLPSAPLLRKISSGIGLSEIVYLRRRANGVEPLGGADLPLRRLAGAEGAVLVPPEREGYPEGTEIEVLPL